MEHEYARLFRDHRYGSTTWSPLASGLLSGKYDKGIPEGSRATLKGYDWLYKEMTDKEKLDRVRRLAPIAESLDCTAAQLAIAWILKNPNVSTVITGASRPEQVRENLQASELTDKITTDIMEEIDRAMGIPAREDAA